MNTTIAGYPAHDVIYESDDSLVYRGRRQRDDRPVILKMLKQAYPSPEQIARFKREYELLRSINVPGVVRADDLTTNQHRPVMVMEDFGGASLDLLMATEPYTLVEFLQLAIQVVDTLGLVHQQHIVHKDINPSNIVLNPTTGQLKLIDFGISTVLSRENPTLRDVNVLEGTLAYMSPEQTGRMNRAIDYRTDFYSLGVTFYELLTGQLPFPITDAMALVHAHIALHPDSPNELKPDIPLPLSDIVTKLMAKNAEDRYQSAYGIKADLEKCLRQLRSTGHIDAFPLGQRDVTDHFHLPQKLYGREAEIDTLLAAFDRVSRGARELMLVSGYAGIGKSALVREVYKPMTQQRGYFVTGKFDQFQKNIPYAALTQGFRAFMRQLLTETEDQIAVWREHLLAALGPNGQIIIDVIPEVELIIGSQPVAPALLPAESQHRFNLVFQNFIQVFARQAHPLVIFLDDLQWSDIASLHLIQRLMATTDSHYLFVIGAYRDNEVSDAHPLMLTVDDVRKSGSIVHHIALSTLGLPHIRQLIADALHCTWERAAPLAELVRTKTDGNPFFMYEFLKSLYVKGLLTFDFQQGGWQWDLAQIQVRDMTDNVVDLMANRVQQLGTKTQQVLKLAACISNRFDLQTLALVYETSPSKTAAALWEAIAEGLVIPLGDTYKLMELDVQGLADTIVADYAFAHDRVQQAAYSLISAVEKQAVHWRVGQLLLQNIPHDEREQKIFDIVKQLNLGIERLDGQQARDELLTLNLMAGKKAKASSAHETALDYFLVGIEQLAEEDWERQYDLTLSLYVEAAEAAYLSGAYLQMEQLIEVVLDRAQTLLDKIQVYGFKIEAGYVAQHRIMEGIRVGLEVLERLGIRFPDNPSEIDVIQGLEETQRILKGKDVGDLFDLPDMTDPQIQATIGILMRLYSPAYVGAPELFSLINFSMVQLSAKHGNTPLSALAYATYGLILCGVVGDIETGYRFGDLALRLVDRFNAKSIKSCILFMFNCFIRHWKEHIGETLLPLLEAYQIGLETGALEWAACAAFDHGFQSYWMGRALTEVEQEMAKYGDAINRLNQGTMLNLNELFRQAALNLMGQAENPCQLSGSSFAEETMLPLLREANNVNALCEFSINKCLLYYLFQDYRQAVEHATLTETYLHAVVGTPLVPIFHFYDSLARLAVWPDATEAERQNLLEKVTANQEKMKLWAHHAPMNYLHKFYLVEAERARVSGDEAEAREYYDQAIDLAQEHRYVNEEALANELAAMFYLARGRTRIAHHYLHDAHYAYLRWGALAKVEDLEVRYPQFLAQTMSDPLQSALRVSTSNTRQRTFSALDLTSVLKASQTISSEIVLDKLLDKLMHIVLENAGAQRGALILEQEGHWVIQAEKTAEADDVKVLQSIPVGMRQDLPATLIRYVERTQENVVLNDAAQEGIFTTDPYIVKHQPKSILCTPLMNQGKLTGILYLENNVTVGAFTPDRLAVLNLLSSQEAISIENARLYKSLQEANTQLEDYSRTLEQRVVARTHELHEKNQELEIANQQILAATERKTQFFNNMSHEIRTPLDAVIGFSEVLQEQAFGELNDKQQEYVDYILASGNHLLSLINDLLDLAKLDAGMMDLQPEVFPLKPLTESSLMMVRERALERNIVLSLEVAEDIDTVVGDERRVKQILLNLLSNAVKFTPDQGHVGLQATRAADRASITVWDTGIGITPADQQRIFEEFQQVEDRHTTKTVGTGLGLALTKKLVELHGSTIEVESQPGRGSTFTFSLPVAKTF